MNLKEQLWCIIDEPDNCTCKHIYGYEEGVDEAWLIFKPDNRVDIVFKFCPRCGSAIRYVEGVWAE